MIYEILAVRKPLQNIAAKHKKEAPTEKILRDDRDSCYANNIMLLPHEMWLCQQMGEVSHLCHLSVSFFFFSFLRPSYYYTTVAKILFQGKCTSLLSEPTSFKKLFDDHVGSDRKKMISRVITKIQIKLDFQPSFW